MDMGILVNEQETRQAIALTEAGREALRVHGAGNLSLRAVAAELGIDEAELKERVSSLEAVLGLVAKDTAERLADVLEAAVHENPDGPIYALGMAYITFAIDEPEVYETFLRMSPPDRVTLPLATSKTGSDAHLILRRTVIDSFPAADLAERDAIATQLWSTVHGFASLFNLGHFGDDPEAALRDAERLCGRVLKGIL